MRTVKIFLASSAELRADRDEFKLAVAARNDAWLHHGVLLQVVAWEHFLDLMSASRLQDEYNLAIAQCELFVMLFHSKVGRYTLEEFETAFGAFKARGKPFLLTYYKQAGATTNTASTADAADQASLVAFQDRLKALGHYQTTYATVDGLNLHFSQQLDRLAASGFIEFSFPHAGADAPDAPIYQARLSGGGAIAQGAGAVAVAAGGVYIGRVELTTLGPRPRPAPPFQAPPPATDHVPRDADLAPLRRCFVDGDGALQPVTVGLHGFGGVGKTTLARLLCANPAVRQACRDGILWTSIGTNAGDPRERLAALVSALTGECNGCSTLDGARAQLQAALAGRQVLLVIDDVWNEAHIQALLDASTGCTRLITTRKPSTLPYGARAIDLRTMNPPDAVQLLGLGLPVGAQTRLAVLAGQLGHWPVLLRLANRSLREHLGQGLSVDAALDAVGHDLGRHGVAAFDPDSDVLERDQAVAATVEASLALLKPAERQRYAELAVFAQDLAIPLAQAAELWRLTAALDEDDSRDLVAKRLDPLSLLDYDAHTGLLRLHDVLRRYLFDQLTGRAALHQLLADHWTDRPAKGRAYAWRWLAHQRAQAVIAADPSARHAPAAALVALVADPTWQQTHQAALQDLPALRDALASALAAAVADESPAGVPLLIAAADALVRFRDEHQRAGPVFDLARLGDLAGARRRCSLLTLDAHWRQALLLTVAWLAPATRQAEAVELFNEVGAEASVDGTLQALAAWVRADLFGMPPPQWPETVPPAQATDYLVEQLLGRLGGTAHDREFLLSAGIDALAQNPDMPTRGLAQAGPGPSVSSLSSLSSVSSGLSGPPGAAAASTRYLAAQDGPYLVAHAVLDPASGSAALARYLGVFASYGYAEYRFSSCWLLLDAAVHFPGAHGRTWVRDAAVSVLQAALGGGSIEFEGSLAVAIDALAAQGGDAAAKAVLLEAANTLMAEATRLRSGREQPTSDRWGHHKRHLLAHAQALGWALGETAIAEQLLDAAALLADSGFAGFQAPACLAMAETYRLCREGDPPPPDPRIDWALDQAQQAAHNVQDPTFCARTSARINSMRRHWWPGFALDARAQRLPEARHGLEFNALHRVGQGYDGRRPGGLPSPAQQCDDRSLPALQLLYQRPRDDWARLNDADRLLQPGDEVAVPDPGLLPLIAARMAAEVLAQADAAPLSSRRQRLLRTLVPFALPNPTALDTVLSRLVLAQARRDEPATSAELQALRVALQRRPQRDTPPSDADPLARQPAPALPS